MVHKTVIFGGPGTGKTASVLAEIDALIKQGVHPSNIAVVAFTRQAAREARERARQRYNLKNKDMPYWRTLHSMAYRELGLTPGEVLQDADWQVIGDLLGMPLGKGTADPLEGPGACRGAAALLTIIQYARAQGVTLDAAWHRHGEGVSWYELKLLYDTIEAYKQDTGKYDFQDLMDLYAREGAPLPVAVGVIDEAQDLTPSQWAVARRALSAAERVVIAGDDDQSLYHWAGADVGEFLWEGQTADERRVLTYSHRLPRQVFAIAQSVVGGIKGPRQAKQGAAANREGAVRWVRGESDVDLSSGSWLLLARNAWLLRRWVRVCREEAVPYRLRDQWGAKRAHIRAIVTWERLRAGGQVAGEDLRVVAEYYPGLRRDWQDGTAYTMDQVAPPSTRIWHDVLTRIGAEDRTYYIGVLKRGERLQDEPRIRVDTVHGAKGSEADHVGLLTDMTSRSYQGYRLAPDEEHRVFYVGVTRARETLHMVAPSCPRHFRP